MSNFWETKPSLQQTIQKCKADFVFYGEEFLKIRNKKREIVPFKLNEPQQKIDKIIVDLILRGLPVRLIILKARQFGVSTYTEARIFHASVTSPYTNSHIVAHEPDATSKIFEMNKFFYESLPEFLRPMKRYDNTTKLTFDNPSEDTRNTKPGLKSEIRVSTADKAEVGRGQTIHHFHGSEVAFWKNAENIMLSVLQAVPNEPGTSVVLESTANGIGGYFYDTWVSAVTGKNDFTPIFLPWFEFKEYRMTGDPIVRTEEERELVALFQLDDDQLRWRRHYIKNQCGGDVMKFKQEYPATWQEAFITSGRPRFNADHLRMYSENAPAPCFIGELAKVNGKIIEVAEPMGSLRIYERPEPGLRYVIGGDTSKGTETSDFACLQVINSKTGNQSATWYGKVSPEGLADIAILIGYYYNTALIGVESNKDGITTNKRLRDERYPNIFRRREVEKIGEDQQEYLGFHTNERSRPLIINELGDWIQEAEFMLYDQETIKQLMTFIVNENGRPEAQEGCHDDAVMALAIAIYLFSYFKALPKKIVPEGVKIKDLKQKEFAIRQRSR